MMMMMMMRQCSQGKGSPESVKKLVARARKSSSFIKACLMCAVAHVIVMPASHEASAAAALLLR
jgi:hypothetical protein